MLTFWGRDGKTARSDFCDGVPRREFLRVGAIGAGALGLSLADVLRLEAAPPPAKSAVPKSRKSVIQIFRHEGFEVREQLFGRDAFYVADEAFMCGTAAEVTPIAEVDRRPVGPGRPGPITGRIQKIYADAVRGRVEWMRDSITIV